MVYSRECEERRSAAISFAEGVRGNSVERSSNEFVNRHVQTLNGMRIILVIINIISIIRMCNIIFGVYSGYNSLKTPGGGIYYFLKSLRKYNKDCKVVIICEKHQIFEDLINFSIEMNFEIYSDFITAYNMMYYRFEIYRKYLTNINLVFDKILLSDISDVIFQEDPFSIHFTEELYCALEQSILNDNTNTSSNLNMSWISECIHLNNNRYENYIDKYVVCAGTILGSYVGIMKYLDFYAKVQKLKIVNDQGLLNVYVYSYLTSKKCLEYKESKIITLDKITFDRLNLYNGNVTNNKGEKYAIIHQINRCNLPFMLSLV
jgi:hypothetical protein